MKTRPKRSQRPSRGAEASASADSLIALGDVYGLAGDYEQARKALLRAVELDSRTESTARLQCAKTYLCEQKFDLALAEVNLALQSGQGGRNGTAHLIDAYRTRSQCYFHLNWMEEYVADLRRVLEVKPDPDLHQRLLFNMNFLQGMTPEAVFEEARRWNALYAAPLQEKIRPHTNVPDPDRRIKVAYLSADLYVHALAKLIAPVFTWHDRSQFDVFAYAVGPKSDAFTETVRRNIDHFAALPFSRKEIVDRIVADEIDILVDLSGHTMGSADAYLAFAVRPAPIQVSWTGVMATTGLSTMDYFLASPDLPYPGTEHLFSETVYRLPRIAGCHRHPGKVPAVAPSPYFEHGYITFGCFTGPRKITREAIQLWSVILRGVPGSRLLFKYFGLEKPMLQERLYRWLEEDGIARERVSFEGPSPGTEYLESWGKVDIALDSFPYQGGTTTVDAISMGVPVVTLSGRLPVQCCGASILNAVGLPIAETAQQYIELALFLAETIPKEPGLRSRVRDAVYRSPLMDEVGLVRTVEAAFRDMWRTWCKQSATRNDAN